MVGDIIQVLSKLSEFGDQFKKADSEKKERIASYFSRIGHCLKEIAQQLKTGELPYSTISELRELAEALPETIGEEISQDKANELSDLLRESLGNDLDDLKDNEQAIRQIEECAGKFDGIAFTIKYSKIKPPSFQENFTLPSKQLLFTGFIGLVVFGLVVIYSWSNGEENKYKQIEVYLKNRDWKNADTETMKILLQAANSAIPNRDSSRNWLNPEDIEELDCKDIKTINELWSTATNNHFGFVTQSRIWQEAGGTTEAKNVDIKVRENFGKKIGWKDAEKYQIKLDQLYKNLEQKTIAKINEGYLPSALGQYENDTVYLGNLNEFAVLTQKIKKLQEEGCEIK